jgi:hypothetical protein
MRVTVIRSQTERKLQDRSVRHAEKRRCRGKDAAGSWPGQFQALAQPRTLSGQKTLVQWAAPGDLAVRRQATWGISVQNDGGETCPQFHWQDECTA